MSTHYTTTAKALHWGMAVLIIGLCALGLYMTGLSLSPTKLQLYSWHKWLGVTVGLLVLLRLALHKLPDTDFAATSWLPLGPLATGCLGLLSMGQAAPLAFAGTPLVSAAELARDLGLIGGLALWGAGLWWLVIATLFTRHYIRDNMPFNLGWWGFTFPLGVFALATLELLRLPEPPTAIITDCNTHGDGAAMALAHLGRLTGDNRVALVVYDGLPQDSIIETDVAAVIQSTRQGVGRQIADMVRRLIAGEDLATLQVLWQPEFIPGETA